MSEEVGTGISLDSQWDIDLNEISGDVATEKGAKELQKDLAFALARAFNSLTGDVVTEEYLEDIRIQTKKLLRSDPRVIAVPDVSVEYTLQNQVISVRSIVLPRSISDEDIDGETITVTFETEV